MDAHYNKEKIMYEIDTKNAKTSLIGQPLAATNAKIYYTYGGYRFSNPEQDRTKILAWFYDHMVLSDEQAVHELHIGNLSKRISELRKLGYVIYGQRFLAEVTPTNEYHSMTYAIHRDMRVAEQMPSPYSAPKAWVEKVNSLLPNHPKFVDLNSDALFDGDICIFIALFEKMQQSALAWNSLLWLD